MHLMRGASTPAGLIPMDAALQRGFLCRCRRHYTRVLDADSSIRLRRIPSGILGAVDLRNNETCSSCSGVKPF